MKPNILIVEDELAIAEGLVDLCEFKGYNATHVADGIRGLEESLSGVYDLVILDLMLPGMDGFTVCNRLRDKDREIPILILSAKTSEADIIEGLKLGADDYVNKPFSVGHLSARIEAVLRRSRKIMEAGNHLTLGSLRINFRDYTGKKNGEEITFTRKEMEILQYLSQHSNRPVSRNELLREVWGYENAESVDTRTVDIHITKLRKKIEDAPGQPLYLVTLRGEGYQLRVPQ
jgi:two-component system response regulator RegX3